MALSKRDFLAGGVACAASLWTSSAEAGLVVAQPGPDGLLRFPDGLPTIVDFHAHCPHSILIRSIECYQLGRPDTQ